MFKKLKRTHSHGYANYIPKFTEVFPELSQIDSEELCDRFRKLKMTFYYEESTPVKLWVRLTLPFAIILMALMLLTLPIKFILTGTWSYSLGQNNRILNWIRALGLNR